jgi:Spy/CpxP family protein refolding chaperone
MFIKITKAFVAALALAGASIMFVADAAAAPRQDYPSQAEQNWMDRASNGGHHEGDTNGY